MKIELTAQPMDEAPPELYRAAVECFLQYGLRKITLEDIARKAGVSRSTIYRQLGGKPEIIQMIAMRELTALMYEVFELLDPNASLETWGQVAFSEGLHILRTNKVIQKAISDERETLALLVIQPAQSPNIIELTSMVLAPLIARNKDADRLSLSPQLAATMIVRLLFAQVLITETTPDEPTQIARALTDGLVKA